METPISSITQTGDLGGQKVKMSIDQNSLAHLMQILTDLYSDPVLAVIREYSTNALDSHIEAGNTSPIEVFTPNSLSPFFRIVDHGVGLSPDDIINMYSKYGASTKRGTNDQVGMLGLGAKSALTLVPQFTLTAVKNGVRTLVSVSRAADGSGQMEIIDTKFTDEPNGVEVAIPVQRSYDFATKCRDFFRFWDPGTVLLDGKQPEPLTGRKVGNKFIINNSLSSDYVVMGNVPYPVPEGIYRAGYSFQNLGIVARVEIGEINFTPSREQLSFTRQTKDTLVNLKEEFKANLHESAQIDVSNSNNYHGAWAAAVDWRSKFALNNFSYKGKLIPTDGYLPVSRFKSFGLGEFDTARSSRWVDHVSPDDVNKLIFVTNFAETLKPSPVQRAKVRKWAEHNGVGPFSRVAVSAKGSLFRDGDATDHVWYEAFTVVDWKDIAPIKIERGPRTYQKRSEPYDLLDPDNYYKVIPTSTFDTTKPIVYYSSAEIKWPSWLYSALPAGAQAVQINKNRWEKFRRDWPTATHYYDAISSNQKKLIDKLTDEDKIIWHYKSLASHYKHWDYDEIDDPDLAAFIKVLSGDCKYSAAAVDLKNTIRSDAGYPHVTVPTPDNPLTKYPMGDTLRYLNNKEHAIWYLNSYYNDVLIKESN